MSKSNYNQFRAMFAITRASLRSILRSPNAMVFSFALPVFFILIFGSIGGGSFSIDVGIDPHSDTTNAIYKVMATRPEVYLVFKDTAQLHDDLKRGKISGILLFERSTDSLQAPIVVTMETSDASGQDAGALSMFMSHSIDKANLAANPQMKPQAVLKQTEMPGRPFSMIDFILPGMLGFSLVGSGVFGTSFVFLSLRNTLVLKRFFATPIRRTYIVFGEALSRVSFNVLTSSLIIILGYFLFHFTLLHGVVTFFEMIFLSFLGLSVFMGFGFIVSSVAKNESAVPALANMITLPQFLLSGTFFSSNAFPSWLQPIVKALPLTHLNNAMRSVAFDGQSLAQVTPDILFLLGWGVVVYLVAIRVFRWE